MQNREFADGSGLELYDFNARTYDQQVGRFIQIDPLTEESSQESLSPYHFSYNNPIRYSDPDGKCPTCIPLALEALEVGVAAVVIYFTADAAVDGAKKLSNVEFKPMSGPLLMSSFGGASLGDIAKSNGKSQQTTVLIQPKDTKKPAGDGNNSQTKGVIYEVPGEATSPGKPYIGRTKNPKGVTNGSQGSKRIPPPVNYNASDNTAVKKPIIPLIR